MTPKSTYQWAFIKSNHPNSAKKYLFVQFNEQVQTALYEVSKKGYCSFKDWQIIVDNIEIKDANEFLEMFSIYDFIYNKKYSSKVFIRKFFQCFK